MRQVPSRGPHWSCLNVRLAGLFVGAVQITIIVEGTGASQKKFHNRGLWETYVRASGAARESSRGTSRCGRERSKVPCAADPKAEVHDRGVRHAQFGQSAERGAILEQLELQLANLEENASQAQAQAELAAATAAAAASAIRVEGFQRKRPARRPLPDDLPRAGSRLSELTDLERDAVHLGAGVHVRCVGKGGRSDVRR